MIRFTKDERMILLFLLGALFIGTSVLYYKRLNPARPQFIEFDEIEIKKFKKIDPALTRKGGVNINTANKEELVRIKGIGPVLAGRIISYREKYGPFEKIEDIKNVKGIGDKTFEKIRKEIILE